MTLMYSSLKSKLIYFFIFWRGRMNEFFLLITFDADFLKTSIDSDEIDAEFIKVVRLLTFINSSF